MEEHKIENLGKYAISIGIAVIIIALITIILQTMRDDTTIVPDQVATFGDNGTARNQSLTWAGNNTAIPFTESRVVTGSVLLYNNGSLVNQGNNYTLTVSDITITNLSVLTQNGELNTSNHEWVTNRLNASYDYNYGSAARNATNQGLEGQQTFAGYLPIVALALAGAIVIGIALRFFGRREFE